MIPLQYDVVNDCKCKALFRVSRLKIHNIPSVGGRIPMIIGSFPIYLTGSTSWSLGRGGWLEERPLPGDGCSQHGAGC